MSEDIQVNPEILREIEVFTQVVDSKEINTEADEMDAARIVQMLKARGKQLDKERTSHTKPLNDRKRSIDKLYRPARNKLAELEKKLKMGIYRSVQARQERNREAMAAAQTAAQTGGNVGQHLDAIDDRPLPPATSIRQFWQYSITDPNLVPPHLWSPDPAKIEAELAKHNDFANPPNISGVSITVGGSVTVRAERKK